MSNAESYDPRMESMPVLISYPRSGSNWLNSIMELYFDRPRLRRGPTTFLKNRDSRKDFMWFHDHDINANLKLTHDNILYLYRDPCDVIFSLLMAEHQGALNKPASAVSLVRDQTSLLKAHHSKYLGQYPSLKYEDCKRDLFKEFKTILTFFNIDGDIDKVRLFACLSRAKKPDLIAKAVDKRYFNKEMMSKEYGKKREEFRQMYGERIYEDLCWEK